jgi:hypothetical protein
MRLDNANSAAACDKPRMLKYERNIGMRFLRQTRGLEGNFCKSEMKT